MKKLTLVLVLALVLCALPIAARAEGTLTVYNWYDYIDESVLDDFTAETGIKVDYVMFTTVEEMYVKMTTGGGKYDINRRRATSRPKRRKNNRNASRRDATTPN